MATLTVNMQITSSTYAIDKLQDRILEALGALDGDIEESHSGHGARGSIINSSNESNRRNELEFLKIEGSIQVNNL